MKIKSALDKEVAKNAGNVLFLDFDGVCNSFDCGSYMVHDPSSYGPDPKILARIREICETCNAKIVISSNWRRHPADAVFVYKDMDYRNPIHHIYDNLGEFVIGTLTKEGHITKSEALELWFEDNPWFNGKYAIVDDDQREGFQFNPRYRPNFWLTERRYGLTERIKSEIIKHFGEK